MDKLPAMPSDAIAQVVRTWSCSARSYPLDAVMLLWLLSLPNAVTAIPFEQVRRSWRGAVQFESTAFADAHSVGLLEMHIGADGRVDAMHPNGCRLSGVIALQSQNFYKIDARTASCSYALLNRRWNGHLIYRQDQRVVVISAMTSDIGPDRKMRQFDFGGTLQR